MRGLFQRHPGAGFLAAGALVVAAAAGARLAGIGGKALWYDEVCSVLRSDGRFEFADPPKAIAVPKIAVALHPRGGLEEVIEVPADPHPPLYFVVLRAWRAAIAAAAGGDTGGTDDAAAGGAGIEGRIRGLSAAASLGALALAAAFAAAAGGRRAGALAAALLALAPLEVAYAQEARPYALLGLFAMLSTFLLARIDAAGEEAGSAAEAGAAGGARRRVVRALWVGYAAAIAAGCATHHTGALVPAVHLAFWFLAGRPATLAALPRALAGAALLYAPIAPAVARSVRSALAAPTGALNLTAQAAQAGGTGAGRAGVPGDAIALFGQFACGPGARPWVGAIVGALLVGLAAIAVRRALSTRPVSAAGRAALLGALLAAAAPALLIALDLAFGSRRAASVRYAFAGAAALPALAAVGLAVIRPKIRWALLVLVIAGQVDGLARLQAAPSKGNDFRGAARLMTAAGCDERDVVILALVWQEQAIELNPHLPGSPSEVIVRGAVERSVLERPWRNVYLLFTADRARAGQALRGFIGASVPEREGARLEGLEVYRFSRGP